MTPALPALLAWTAGAALLLAQAWRWRRGMALLEGEPRPAQTGGLAGRDPIAPGVWLVLAARDEAEHLAALARALEPQRGRLRGLVLADDGSRDGTAARARQLFAHWSGAQVLALPPAGKIAALSSALARILPLAADQDLVLFTDGDCRPEADWVVAHVTAHEAGAGLVCGHVVLHEQDAGEAAVGNAGAENWRFRRFESAVSSLQCALDCAAQAPRYARGGNWSVRAGLLRGVGGFSGLEGLASGDDVHLVGRLVRASVHASFLTEPGSRVHTWERAEATSTRRQARRRYGKVRDLPRGEQARQGLLFLALAAQPVLLAWFAWRAPWLALLPAVLLLALALWSRDMLGRGFMLLGEQDLARRVTRRLARLAWHALTHSLAGGLLGYGWRATPAASPREGGRERTE